MDAGIKILADKITSHPEQELSIETLAADIFVSKYYLIRRFKSNIGMTPHQFCIQNRIRKSQGMLNEKKAISRIAAEMGFYDQSHFDKAFQRIVGISPSEYVHSKKQIAQGT
jgi:AraC-like DNA-binding protein